MSESQYAPGPIEIEFDGKFTVTYRVGDQESAFRVLPEVGRLIAAAPDLLAALERMTRVAIGYGVESRRALGVDDARAAIRKAKGESA